MSVLNRKGRQELEKRQNGRSPITGRRLKDFRRIEISHKIPAFKGGGNNRDNLVVLPVSEHLAFHFKDSVESRSERDRIMNLDVVFGRLHELNDGEIKDMNEVIRQITGRRIVFH